MLENLAPNQSRTTMSQVKLTIIFFSENIPHYFEASCKECMDVNPGLLEGQEDCLYINVYRPEAEEEEAADEPQELLPVSC